MSEGAVAWFAPKRHGDGTGLPIAWQGWALPGGYLTLVLLLAGSLLRHPVIGIVLLIVATAAFGIVAKRRTRGGWRWRSGE